MNEFRRGPFGGHAALAATGGLRNPPDDGGTISKDAPLARSAAGVRWPMSWRDEAVLATAATVAAGSNLAAMYVAGGIPWTPAAVPFFAFLAAVDASVTAYLAACLLAIQRPNLPAAGLSVAVAVAPVAVSSTKFVIIGTPAFFEDVLLLGDLMLATEPAVAGFAVASAAASVAAIACNIRLVEPKRVLLKFCPLIAAVIVLAAASRSPAVASRLVAWQTTVLPPKVSDLPATGHVLGAVSELVTSLDRKHAAEAARASDQRLPSALGPVGSLEHRNIHVVMVESLIDPAWLPTFAWSREPLSPLFARWRERDGSTAIVSIFGDRSANTEFEVLCGLPAAVGPSDVVFRLIPAGSELPCLPRLLAAQGFRTVGTRVTGPEFYNGGGAFAAAGFETRVFAPDLAMADRDGLWLSAEATLRQAEGRAASLSAANGGVPVLNYVVVAAGHYPYERDKARRPDRVSVVPDDPLIRDYVNAAHYNAVAVEDFVRRVAEADPRALIVVLGDHQPLLGPNYRGYRAGGRLPPVGDVPPLHRATMFETPLLVLDAGEAVAVGRLPAYLLPEVILDRLSRGEYCRSNNCAYRGPWRLRPFRDHAIEVEAHGRGERFCPIGKVPAVEPLCAAATARSQAMQAALLQALYAPRKAAAAPAE